MLTITLDESDCFAAWVSAKDAGFSSSDGSDPKCRSMSFSILSVILVLSWLICLPQWTWEAFCFRLCWSSGPGLGLIPWTRRRTRWTTVRRLLLNPGILNQWTCDFMFLTLCSCAHSQWGAGEQGPKRQRLFPGSSTHPSDLWRSWRKNSF